MRKGRDRGFPVFQWHEDTFDLPEEAVCLAGSGTYPNQAMRIGSLSYGFQFHFEITKEMIVSWLKSGSEEIKAMGDTVFSMYEILRETDRCLNEAHTLGALFFMPYLKSITKMFKSHQDKMPLG